MSTKTQIINDLKNERISHFGEMLIGLLKKIEHGRLTVFTPSKQTYTYKGDKPGQNVTVLIKDWKIAQYLFLRGDIGLGESFVEDMWECDNIDALILLGLENEQAFKKAIFGSLPRIIFYKVKHLLNRNTIAGSRKNIHKHYDLGNDFYSLWLDETMTYSSALFSDSKMSLSEAQENKYQNILDQLNISPGDHILEIGCGWGGFMEYAAKRGIKVTGVTISKEQAAFAMDRLSKYGELCNVEVKDYRNITGQFDFIVSIEMFEALGKEYWNTYFKKVRTLLSKNGKAVIQTITIDESVFKGYSRGTDFIQQYIFPGGMLPTPTHFRTFAAKTKLDVVNEISFGLDYAKTLDNWHIQFNEKKKEVMSFGFDQRFIRMWNFYLKYCEGAFKARRINVFQFLLKG